MRVWRRQSTAAGVSLLQILFVVVLVAVFVAPILNLILGGYNRISRSEAYLDVIHASYSLLEAVNRMDLLMRCLGKEIVLPSKRLPGLDLPSRLRSRYGARARLVVRRAEGYRDALRRNERDLYEVLLTVEWREGRGRFRTQMASMRGNVEETRMQ